MPTERAMRAFEQLHQQPIFAPEHFDMLLDLPALEAVAEAAEAVCRVEVDFSFTPWRDESGQKALFDMDYVNRLLDSLSTLRAELAKLKGGGK